MSVDFDDELLQEINENIDLVEIAEDFIPLSRKGSDEYFGHCSLHIDNTPSLTISNNKFFCFSCHASGGVIGFLIKYGHMSMEEAVQYCANILELDLSVLCLSDTVKYLKRHKREMESIAKKEKVFHQIFPKYEIEKYPKEQVIEWEEEGIDPKVMDLFGVRVDKLANRIVYPVYDIDGNLINIKGRSRYKNYKKLGISKYMNYKKIGTMDYFQCLNVTLPYIKEKGEIIVFESIKSVMKAYGWGYKNCVSAEKHTLTSEQISLLVSLKVNIVFAYDSDVDYFSEAVQKDIDKLRLITNVYIINDTNLLLGGKEAKNAPVDLGKEIWETLYNEKEKIT